MSTQYKFEQISTIVSGKFDEIRSKCEKLGIGKEHILDLFLRSRIKKVTEEDDSLYKCKNGICCLAAAEIRFL